MKRRAASNMSLSSVINHVSIKVVYFNVGMEDTLIYKLQIEHMNLTMLTAIVKASEKPITTPLEAKFEYDPKSIKEVENLISYPIVLKLAKSLPMDKKNKSAHSSKSRVRVKESFSSRISMKTQSPGRATPEHQYGVPSECIIDILPFIMGDSSVLIEKRFEPTVTQTVLTQKTWKNLPRIKLRITSFKHDHFIMEQNYLEQSYVMDLKLIALTAYDDISQPKKLVYTANSVKFTPDKGLQGISFGDSTRTTTFNNLDKYYKWATLQLSEVRIVDSDIKVNFNKNNFTSPMYQNETCEEFISIVTQNKKCIEWTSFQRFFIHLNNIDKLASVFRQYSWPFAITITDYNYSLYLTGFVNVFDLLRPGVTKVSSLIEVKRVSPAIIRSQSGIDGHILTGSQKLGSPGSSKREAETSWYHQVLNTKILLFVEIELSKPLRDVIIEHPLPDFFLKERFLEEQLKLKDKFQMTSKALDDNWNEAVKRIAASICSLSPLQYLEACNLIYGMSCTRSWTELTSAISRGAHNFVYQNFSIKKYLRTEKKYKELLKLARIVLMREAYYSLQGININAIIDREINDRELRIARNYRNRRLLQSFLQVFVRCLIRDWNNAALWRELGITLRPTCRLSSEVCIRRALYLDPKNKMNLLIMGTLLGEINFTLAEPFFEALYTIHPLWLPGLITLHCYYEKRELFQLSQRILTELTNVEREYHYFVESYPELEHWWDPKEDIEFNDTFSYTAYLLLKIGALDMADVCLSRALVIKGKSPLYYHLLAVGRALRGDFIQAECICRKAVRKYGELSYIQDFLLRCIKLVEGMVDEFSLEEAISLAQAQPSGYNWSIVAKLLRKNDMLKDAELVAMHALSIDRFEGAAWYEMAMSVRDLPPPGTMRYKFYCLKARSLGYSVDEPNTQGSATFSDNYECCGCDEIYCSEGEDDGFD